MGKTNYQTANKRLVLPCIPASSHRGSWALATRLAREQHVSRTGSKRWKIIGKVQGKI